MKTFYQLLLNALLSGVTSTFLWFAVTFWIFLETRSVVTTAVVGGTFSLTSALLGMVFGTFVDRHRKHWVMMVASATSLASYAVASVVYVAVDQADLLRLTNVAFWLFVAAILAGSVAGNLRSIAMSTCVTLLVPDDRRDSANGMVGTVMGASYAITSVFSGLVVGRGGMGGGVDLIGDWFSVGPERGLALIFTLAGLVGVVITVRAFASRSYRTLTTATAT